MCVSQITSNNANIQLKPLNISKNEPVKLRNLFPKENKAETNTSINTKDQNNVKTIKPPIFKYNLILLIKLSIDS